MSHNSRSLDSKKLEVTGALLGIERHLASVQDLLNSLSSKQDIQRVASLATDLVDRALSAATSLGTAENNGLPVTLMKASDVVENKLIDLSQPTLYRAAQQHRFYSIAPPGRTNGALYPTWQFVSPVPELIEEILKILAPLPSSEIHAFWTTASDDLNELAPAEMLAGKPFVTRHLLDPSQSRFMNLPTHSRVGKVRRQAQMYTGGMTDI